MTDLSKPDAPVTTTETLLTEHTHGGAQKYPGDRIEVTAPERAWLIEQGVIADTSADPGAKTKTAKE